MAYEDLVHQCLGEFGRYQIWINFLTAFIYIPAGWQLLSMNFLAADTQFWCQQPQDTADKWGTVEEWVRVAHPKVEGLEAPDRCKIFAVNFSTIADLDSENVLQ